MKHIANLHAGESSYRVMLKDDDDTREEAICRAVDRAYGKSAYVGGGLYNTPFGGVQWVTICGKRGNVIGRARVSSV